MQSIQSFSRPTQSRETLQIKVRQQAKDVKTLHAAERTKEASELAQKTEGLSRRLILGNGGIVEDPTTGDKFNTRKPQERLYGGVTEREWNVMKEAYLNSRENRDKLSRLLLSERRFDDGSLNRYEVSYVVHKYTENVMKFINETFPNAVNKTGPLTESEKAIKKEHGIRKVMEDRVNDAKRHGKVIELGFRCGDIGDGTVFPLYSDAIDEEHMQGPKNTAIFQIPTITIDFGNQSVYIVGGEIFSDGRQACTY